jgi:imidazolonepropionase-like amidohydrolase
MRRYSIALAALIGTGLGIAQQADAQNLVVSNARIIVGNGEVIDNGSIVVRDGRIASVAAGPAPRNTPAGATRIDGSGFTVIAGYIDDHRHLIQGQPEQFFKTQAADRMRELLEAGFTTIQSGGDNDAGIIQLKKMTQSGEIKGPRILASGRVPVSQIKTEEETRAAVRRVIQAGADTIAEVHYPVTEFPNPPALQETRNLTAAIDEALKFNVEFQVHAVSPDAVRAAIYAGARRLIHTPHNGWLIDADAKLVVQSGAKVSSCTGFGAPVFDVFNHDNVPTFRDGGAWPDSIIGNEGRGREAGYKPVNGRTLFDNGVVYGFCTDTTYYAPAALMQELRVLSLMFSPKDLVKIMGQNSAEVINMEKEIGTLEVGKRGDLLVLTGNPLEGVWNFSTPVVVAKDGVVLVDKRSQLKTIRVLPYERTPLRPRAAGPGQAGPPSQ